MEILTTRFGRVQIALDDVIQFPKALYGLPQARQYCLLSHGRQGSFAWLQSVDKPSIAMVVTDPFLYWPNYEVHIDDQAAELLQAETSQDVTIYASITVAADHSGVYANLLGPLAVNHKAGVGMQLIQDANRYSTRHALALNCVAGKEAAREEQAVA